MTVPDALYRITEEIQRLPASDFPLPAGYIPPLAEVDRTRFGAAFVGINGYECEFGDPGPFSWQSITKVRRAHENLRRLGLPAVRDCIAMLPLNTPFNDWNLFYRHGGRPLNVYHNAGAIRAVGLAMRYCIGETTVENLLGLYREAGADVWVNDEVRLGESQTGVNNRMFAHEMRRLGNLDDLDPDVVVEEYFAQCAIEGTALSMAKAHVYLANEGIGLNGTEILTHDPDGDNLWRKALSTLLHCGMYAPATLEVSNAPLIMKSGVGGGLLIVLPKVGIVVFWSPGMNEDHNPYMSLRAAERFVRLTGISLF